MAEIIVFPLAAQRALDPDQAAHNLGQADEAARRRMWAKWYKATMRKLTKRGVPHAVADDAVAQYSRSVRQAAGRLGYLHPDRDRDRAS